MTASHASDFAHRAYNTFILNWIAPASQTVTAVLLYRLPVILDLM